MNNENRLRSIDDLEQNILSLARQINVATYELLIMVREFDERAGFLKWCQQNTAEWLAWRCDISMNAAREKVRVAHALKVLPAITEAFASGELSYTKVRAMTRVATRENEKDLLEFALRHTAVNVEQRCRELRFGRADSVDVAQRAFESRSLRIIRNADRAMMTITVDLPVELGELVDKALDKAREDDAPELVETSWQAKQADAFVTLMKDYLCGTSDDKPGSSRDNYLVTVHVDQSALAGNAGRSALPIETVKRLSCDGSAVVITEDKRGEPLDIGRKSRIVPLGLERAVRSRDNDTCRFPGCHNKKFTDCHHIEHWASGGETRAENLMLLCSRHHESVHEGRYRILKDYEDNWFFARPDGVAIPEGGIGDVGNPPAEGLLSEPENTVRELPPPDYLH